MKLSSNTQMCNKINIRKEPHIAKYRPLGGDLIHGGLSDDQITGNAGQYTSRGNSGEDLASVEKEINIAWVPQDKTTAMYDTYLHIHRTMMRALVIVRIVRVFSALSLPKAVPLLAFSSTVCENSSPEGDDTLVGTNGADVICGLGGDDFIDGRSGDDTILGGTGDDRLYGRVSNDIIRGGLGNDLILGHRNDDMIYGGLGDDRVYGAGGNDTIEGGPGDDRLFGDDDNDVIEGGEWSDLIHGGWCDDIIRGGPGNDTIRGNAGFDVIYRELATDVILGLSHEDFVIYENYRTRGQR